jgi:hypothetical protein
VGRRGREDRKREAHRVPRWVVADLPSPPGESGKRLALTRYGLIEVVKSPLIGISPLIVLVTLSGCDTEQAQRPTYDPDTQVVITKSEYAGLKKVGRFQPFRDVLLTLARGSYARPTTGALPQSLSVLNMERRPDRALWDEAPMKMRRCVLRCLDRCNTTVSMRGDIQASAVVSALGMVVSAVLISELKFIHLPANATSVACHRVDVTSST